MECPRCETPLTEGRHEDVRVLVCESCSGCLIERRRLLKVLDGLARALFTSVHPDVVFPPAEGPEAAIECPGCLEAMECYGYMGSRKIMIDGCEPCERLWLDAGEMLAMARMHVRHDKRMERFEMSARPADLVGLQMTLRWTEAALMGSGLLALRSFFLD